MPTRLNARSRRICGWQNLNNIQRWHDPMTTKFCFESDVNSEHESRMTFAHNTGLELSWIRRKYTQR